MNTLNQLTDKIREWAKDHPFINDYGIGPVSMVGMKEPMRFPYLWTSMKTGTILINHNVVPIPTFQFLFMDKTNKSIEINRDNNGLDTTDGMEVVSDTYRLVLDFIKWLDDLDGISIESNQISVQPIIDETKEIATGWLVEISIKMVFIQCNDIVKQN